jgi:thioesterase domain-containing protein
MGGLIAFDVARRLRQQGEEVAFLAILDAFPNFDVRSSHAPHRGRHLAQLNQLRWSDRIGYLGTRIWRTAKFQLGRNLPLLAKKAGSQAACGMLRFLHMPISQKLLWFPQLRAVMRIADAYNPQEYDGKLTLFYPADEPRDLEQWSRRVRRESMRIRSPATIWPLQWDPM